MKEKMQPYVFNVFLTDLQRLLERDETPTEFKHHLIYFHVLPAVHKLFGSMPDGGITARKIATVYTP